MTGARAELLFAALASARSRTLALIGDLSERDIERPHTPLLSPLAWDLGHIAAFEDLWLCRRVGGLEPLQPDLAEVYDASETPRSGRAALPIMGAEEVLAYMDEVRGRATAVLEDADLSSSSDRLNADGFVWDMVIQHEQQHNETMLQTLQFAEPGLYVPDRAPLPREGTDGPELVEVDAGRIEIGAGPRGFAYDNERPRQVVELDAFRIDRLPVTNAAFAEFIEADGYRRRELWSAAGWDWRARERAQAPLYWSGGEVRSFDRVGPIDGSLPVMHVSWYEADAYARWRGKRLPTEFEWEAAAAGADPDHANLGQLAFGPAAAGAYPAGASASGVCGLLGDAWEWTSSEFSGYPSFQAFPYDDYSEVFFDRGYGVLRGGSWATARGVIRTSFRNWDHLDRRQIFSGFRCVERAGA